MIGIEVVKRDGHKEPFSMDKITKMYNFCRQGLNIDDEQFWKEFRFTLKSGITTKEIQQNLIATANKLSISDKGRIKDYSILAGRFYLLDWIKDIRLHREREYDTFTDDYGFFQNANDWIFHLKKYIELGIYDERILKISNDILEELYEYAKKVQLDYNYNFPYFMWNDFYYQVVKFSKSYILTYNNRPIETFAEALLLISILGFLPDYKQNKELFIDNVKKFYKLLLDRTIIPATPQLSNLRRAKGNLSSCNILDIHDNLESIMYSFWQVAEISKRGGGLGIYLGEIRPNGSYIQGNKGKSVSILKWCKILDDMLDTVDQLGKRKGAGTVALPIWHMDILDFMAMRNPIGEIRMKMFSLYPQVVIPDLFMEKVKENKDWTLIDHYELKMKYGIDLVNCWGEEFEENYMKAEELVKQGKVRGKVYKAREIYRQLIKNILASGMPYLFFVDTVNQYSPFKEQIKCGNLCVAPDTRILTKEYGYIEIKKVAGQILEVWNGVEWSKSAIFKTGDNYSDWYEIEFTNGEKIIVTDYHRWYVRGDKARPYHSKTKVKRTFELSEGDVLEKWNLPVIEGYKILEYAYENGLFTAEGTAYDGVDCIYLYDKKRKLIDYLSGYYRTYSNKKINRIDVYYKKGVLKDKFFVPDSSYTVESRIRWLEGLFDGDGTVVRNGNTYTLQLSSINFEFLLNVKRMLDTLGIQSKIVDGCEAGYRSMPDGKGGYKDYYCKETKRILISAYNLAKLIELGFNPKRLDLKGRKVPNREASQFVRVKSIRKLDGFVSDSYCFFEPKLNRGILNGVLTGNCVESYSPFSNSNPEGKKPDEKIEDLGYVHSCNLLSLNLPVLYELGYLQDNQKLSSLMRLVVRYMDNILDIAGHPIYEIKKHNQDYRTLGIGFVGLADLLVRKSIDNGKLYAYRLTSRNVNKDELFNLLKQIFGRIAFYSIRASVDLAKERGRANKYSETKWDEVFLGQIPYGEGFEVSTTVEFDVDRGEVDELIEDIQKYGIRNTMLLNAPPNTSTSIYAGTTASISPPFNLIQTEKQSTGVYVVFPRYITEGWFYYDEYSKFTEQDLYDVIEIVSFIQKYIDSGISFDYPVNIRDGFIPKEEVGRILGQFIYKAWKSKIKALYYARIVAKAEGKQTKEECVSCAN